jgi:hypothetical protein
MEKKEVENASLMPWMMLLSTTINGYCWSKVSFKDFVM